MKIAQIKISNFRLLKDFTLDLEDELSLVIGKNNTGKTSILTCLDKMVNQSERKAICYEDFNVDLRENLEKLITGKEDIGSEDDFSPLGIQLKIYIKYDDKDDLSQISSVIMSLDPNDNNLVLSFEYSLSFYLLKEMKSYYEQNASKFDDNPALFLKEHLSEYFGTVIKKSLLFTDESQFIDLQKEKINLKDILAIQFISAKRSVTNKQNDRTLSTQTSALYKQTDESDEQLDTSDEFKQELRKTDKKLDDIYKKLFKDVIKKVSKFGGVNPHDTTIKVSSTLQHRDLLEGNTTVMYSHEKHDFPEHYNGLGYMNLISMIFDIEMLMTKLRRSEKEKPAALNLLFIEEPEAHTHPQMQYVFIKNIKNLLNENRKREDGEVIHLQSIITTHSSHIVSESKFDDIKYLKKSLKNHQVEAKNLKDLEKAYSSTDSENDKKLKQSYKFLKQYLTLNRAELFFADKAIFIEGDTERVILPAMMKKIDQEYTSDGIPLLSQNISIVEVGAHSQTFEKFIHFIGVKSLIITDIDSNKEIQEDGKVTRKKCKPSDSEASETSNASLNFFFQTRTLDFYKGLTEERKILQKEPKTESWTQDENGQLMIVYQVEEANYHARSFEDAFFHINKSILNAGYEAFQSLTKTHYEKYIGGEYDAYDFAETAVNSKPSLAIEILLNSESDVDTGYEFVNWKIPAYIKEGLLWLKQD